MKRANLEDGKSLIGRELGYLTIIMRHVEPERFTCRCICGSLTVIPAAELLKYNRKDCGCGTPRKRNNASDQEILMRKAMSNVKAAATSRSIPWTLTDDMVSSMIVKNCAYCGDPPSCVVSAKRAHGIVKMMRHGIDRVDNNEGYTPENTVACCKRCNRAKSDWSIDEFVDWALRIAEHQAPRIERIDLLKRVQIAAAIRKRDRLAAIQRKEYPDTCP